MGTAGFGRSGDSFVRWITTRTKDDLNRVIPEIEAELRTAQARVDLATVARLRHQDEFSTDDPRLDSAKADAADVWRRLATAKHELKLLELKAENERRRHIYDQQ